MVDDEIKEVRRIRHEISARYNHDLDKLVAYYQQLEAQLKAEGKYRFEEVSACLSESLGD